MMQNINMRTTVALDEDVHEFVDYYAQARGITLSAALNELVRKAEAAPKPEPNIVIGPHGLPMLPPRGCTITAEIVKKLEEGEFDPSKFA